jgi:methionyl-tRNA formyltransferase
MLRAYSRRIIDTINRCGEINTFIPALAYTFAENPVEIDVAHEERFAGESKYSLYGLIRLNFDLVTGFSVVPLQWLSFTGIVLAALSAALFLLLVVRRFVLGAEVQGVFTLFAITFFMLGVIVFALGLLGEYIGRIYQQVRARPRYLVQTVLEGEDGGLASGPESAARLNDTTLPAPARARAVVFAYHNVGVRCLQVLLARGVDVALVVTHQDQPGETIWFDSVAALAARHGIPVIMPQQPDGADLASAVREAAPDFIFSFYYRYMLPAAVLELAPRGAFNMHGSLLPKYRGRVPVNWAVLNGETETGATLHEMAAKPDAGAIIGQTAVPILPDDTAVQVFEKVTVAAEQTLARVLPKLLDGNAPRLPNSLAAGSYYGARGPEDGRIDWRQPAQQVYNLVRAVAPPYPGAFTYAADAPDAAAGDAGRGGQQFVVARARLATSGEYSGNLPLGLQVVDNAVFGVCGDGRALFIEELRERHGDAGSGEPAGPGAIVEPAELARRVRPPHLSA